MFEKYPYKLKLKLLALIFVMLSIAAYRRSFGPLAAVIKEHTLLSEKVTVMGDNTKNADKLNREIAGLDKQIGKEGLGKEIVQQEIIGFVTRNSPRVSVNDLQAIHVHTTEDYRIYTYQLDLVGDFNSLIQLSYAFEKKFEYSKIARLNFYTEKNSNQNEALHLKIIFQNYENNK